MIQTIALLVVIALLLLYLTWTEIAHRRIEKDLLDRLMAKDYSEYAMVRHGDKMAEKERPVVENKEESDYLSVG